MTRGAIFVTEGFDESQFVYANYRFREDGIIPAVATPGGGTVEGERGMTVTDTLGADYGAALDRDGNDSEVLDFVVVPGSPALERDIPAGVRAWLRTHLDAASVFGCLGTGVVLLVAIDGVSGRVVTGPDELGTRIDRAGGEHTGERVTVDGNLVTGQNTAAVPFFLAAVRNTLAIPQDPDAAVRNRPFQERAAWSEERGDS